MHAEILEMNGHEVWTLFWNGSAFKIKVYKDKYGKILTSKSIESAQECLLYYSPNFSIDLNFFKIKYLGGVW